MRLCRKQHGSLPPAYTVDKNGTPINSWRLLAVRYFYYNSGIGGDELKGNGQDRGSTPWELRCPAHRAQYEREFTDYVAVIGANTMWPGSEGAVPAADGSDNDKILIIEIMNSDIYWMEPRDLTLQQALDAVNPRVGIGIGSTHQCGINYLTVGGEVRSLRRDIDRNTLRKLLVRD